MLAVGLIEIGGHRSPLGVAAIGAGLGLVAIVVLEGAAGQAWTVLGALIGSAAAAALYGGLRALDPECADPRWHGRSALLIAGCWVGGLGAVAFAAGAGAWIVIYLLAISVAWWRTRHSGRGAASNGAGGLMVVPLVPAIAAALVASLLAGR